MPRTPEERRERAYDLRLQRVYGITAEQFDAIVEAQGDVCGLCELPPPEGTRLVVDHDHKNRRVRGGLHFYCNRRVLGRTTLAQAQAMCRYLANPPADRILGEDHKVPVKKRKPRRKRSVQIM